MSSTYKPKGHIATVLECYRKYDLYPEEIRSDLLYSPNCQLLAASGVEFESFYETLSPYDFGRRIQAYHEEKNNLMIVYFEATSRKELINTLQGRTTKPIQLVYFRERYCSAINFLAIAVQQFGYAEQETKPTKETE